MLDRHALALIQKLYAACDDALRFDNAVSEILDYLTLTPAQPVPLQLCEIVEESQSAAISYRAEIPQRSMDRQHPSPGSTGSGMATTWEAPSMPQCPLADSLSASTTSVMLAHIDQARAISAKITRARASLGDLRNALDRLRMGWAMSDRNGLVDIVSNVSTNRFRNYGIKIESGKRLCFQKQSTQREYEQALGNITESSHPASNERIVLKLNDGKPGTRLLVLSTRTADEEPWSPLFLKQRYVMHFLIDAADQNLQGELSVYTGAKLTASEAQVLQYLSAGLAARDIAILISRSELTVRDHIKSLLRKTDSRRQHELVASLFRNAAWLVQSDRSRN